jgi:hypothetical protein
MGNDNSVIFKIPAECQRVTIDDRSYFEVVLGVEDVGKSVNENNIKREMKECNIEHQGLFISIDNKKIGTPELVDLELKRNSNSNTGGVITYKYKCYDITKLLETRLIDLISAPLESKKLDLENKKYLVQ